MPTFYEFPCRWSFILATYIRWFVTYYFNSATLKSVYDCFCFPVWFFVREFGSWYLLSSFIPYMLYFYCMLFVFKKIASFLIICLSTENATSITFIFLFHYQGLWCSVIARAGSVSFKFLIPQYDDFILRVVSMILAHAHTRVSCLIFPHFLAHTLSRRFVSFFCQ